VRCDRKKIEGKMTLCILCGWEKQGSHLPRHSGGHGENSSDSIRLGEKGEAELNGITKRRKKRAYKGDANDTNRFSLRGNGRQKTTSSEGSFGQKEQKRWGTKCSRLQFLPRFYAAGGSGP